jgi:hypothetical protein
LELSFLEKKNESYRISSLYNECLRTPENSIQLLDLVADFDFYYVFNISLKNHKLIEPMAHILEKHYFSVCFYQKTRDGEYLNQVAQLISKITDQTCNLKALS